MSQAPSSATENESLQEHVQFLKGVQATFVREAERKVMDGVIARLTSSAATDISALVDKVLDAYPEYVMEYRAGKEKSFNSLVAQVMKASEGEANPATVNALLRSKLASSTTESTDLAEACAGLVNYWTRNLRNFQWEKADYHVKRINIALGNLVSKPSSANTRTSRHCEDCKTIAECAAHGSCVRQGPKE